MINVVLKKRASERRFRQRIYERMSTMRKPEPTSVAWLMAFNRVDVGNSYELLRDVRLKYSFTAEQIYKVYSVCVP